MLSASGSSSGSRRVWRSTASQRRQTARAPGGSGGMICICPQSGALVCRLAVTAAGSWEVSVVVLIKQRRGGGSVNAWQSRSTVPRTKKRQ